MSTEVTLVPPNPDWSRLALDEAPRFLQAAGDAVATFHHIGSTSIPGIWAKPVIDLIAEVHSLEKLELRRPAIEAAGYEFWGEYGLPRRRFCPRTEDGQRLANLHCYQSGDPELLRHLAFRDYLRVHPDLAQQYQNLKQHCCNQHPNDVMAYSACKNDWIRATETTALEWVKRNRESSDRAR